jgi:hypothetical protein
MSSNETNWIRRTGIDVGEAPITGTTEVVAGIRSKAGESNVAILLQPLFDSAQPSQIGEGSLIMWYGALGERFASMGPHAGGHDHFSIYTKIDGAGDGDNGLEKRLDIDFGTAGDNNADVKWSAVKEFHITNDGGAPLMGVGTGTPEDELHVYNGTASCVIQIESDAAESSLEISAHTGFDSLILFREGTNLRWQIYNDFSLGNDFTIYEFGSTSARIVCKGGDETVINEGGLASDTRIEASGEPNALLVNGTTAEVSVAGNRVVGAGTQSTTLGAAATTFVADQKFIILTGDAGSNTIATITGDMAFAGNEITILFVDALVTITDTDAHTADTVDLSAAFTSADDTVLKLVYDGASWYEVSRSVN